MSDWQKNYWRFFNIVLRIIGAWFVFGGVVFFIWGISLILDPKATIEVNGVPTGSIWAKAMMLVVGIVAGVMGILLILARPFRGKIK
jgi:nitrate reductase gamma subunit